MLRKIIVFMLIVFFTVGTLTAMAGDKSSCQGKNCLQSVYNWFSELDKGCCAKTAADKTCKTCGKACCNTCQTDCGGKCCSACGKKK